MPDRYSSALVTARVSACRSAAAAADPRPAGVVPRDPLPVSRRRHLHPPVVAVRRLRRLRQHGRREQRRRLYRWVGSAKESVRAHIQSYSVPARLGKGQGAKEVGHNLAREQPKFGHNLVRERHIIGHGLERE